MPKKRGKLSTEEEQFIREHVNSLSIEQIAVQLNRTEEPIEKFCAKNNLTFQGMSTERYDDTLLKAKLEKRPYWNQVKNQFTDEELQYFRSTWVEFIKQFNEDIKYTEELQCKQWITLEIMDNRLLKERKNTIEQMERLQAMLERETAIEDDEIRDHERIAALETELSMLRNSLSNFTGERAKILDKIKDIQKDLKAARADRVKKIEDSKTTWTGLLRTLEDEDMRKRLGNEIAIMKMAKEKAYEEFSKPHVYEDGQIDQPILNSDNYIEEEHV